ncbi:uncharacterized protein LOC114969323 isoform X2 [Acropora millepora]|uniref:uncharacterized protein LOC114969323 isoform X2 n=1 Tax=Acropora millepora TaxID=45264 RepID=UPI001CF29A9B|nr:uncharacterized protein LOC114969323 isoform X2 [Acropora millepora]
MPNKQRVMSSIVWLTGVFSLCTLLSLASNIQEVGKNHSIHMLYIDAPQPEECKFSSEKGMKIDLTSLDGKKDEPRYKTEDSKSGYEYGYSPCKSLSWGPAGIGDCHDSDVAVCMRNTTKSSYQNIGRRSSRKWFYDKDSEHNYLEYRSLRDDHRWVVHVQLKCDDSLKEEAKFAFVEDIKNIKTFTLRHECLCEGQCLQSSQSPAPTWMFVIIGVGAFFLVTWLGLAAIFHYFKRIMVPPPLANQGQAADAFGNVHEYLPGVGNIDPHIRDEKSPLLAKCLNVKNGEKKNSKA